MNDVYTILVTGSRERKNKEDYLSVARHLGIAIKNAKDAGFTQIVVMHGGAQGIDAFAEEFVNKAENSLRAFGVLIKTKVFRPKYDKYPPKQAPIMRNIEMVDLKPDICLAFPAFNSRGTIQCIDYAKKQGLKVDIFK